MAVSFIVENGTGLVNANSYVSVQEATDYFSVDAFENPGWSSLAQVEKEYLLIKATRFLDNYYDYLGDKVFQAASLRWPRSGVVDLDGNTVSSNIVPVAIKNAVCEFAHALITEDLGEEPDDRGLQSLKVSSIELVFDKTDKKGYVPLKTRNWLRGYGRMVAGSRVVRLIPA